MEDVIYPCLECSERQSCTFFLENAKDCAYDIKFTNQQLQKNDTIKNLENKKV